MKSMISIMERDTSPDSIRSLSKSIVDTYNKYSSQKKNNMYKFEYCGEITEGVSNINLEALDHYCVTKDIVYFVRSYYEEEMTDILLMVILFVVLILVGRKILKI